MNKGFTKDPERRLQTTAKDLREASCAVALFNHALQHRSKMIAEYGSLGQSTRS